jgi:hypothetical protein
MDFEYAPEQEAFRKEFRGWLAANLPPDLCIDDPADDRVASTREMFERRVAWQKTMHKAGWSASAGRGVRRPRRLDHRARDLGRGVLGRAGARCCPAWA